MQIDQLQAKLLELRNFLLLQKKYVRENLHTYNDGV